MPGFSSLIIALATAAIALNDMPPLVEKFSVRCDGVSARHITWRNQKWLSEELEPSSWKITTTADSDCHSSVKKIGLTGGNGEYVRETCLDIRPVDSDYRPPIWKSNYCIEAYSKSPAGVWIISFSCERVAGHFRGEVDGEFKRVSTVNFVSFSEKAKRNGTTIETGYCRRMDE